MKHIKTYEIFLIETIRSEEAHRDQSAVQTVIDGKRGVGFITIVGSTLDPDEFWAMVKKFQLKTLKVKGSKHEAYIYYNRRFERDALELKEIAEKYGGYLAWDASEADSHRIGELLGYDRRDIDDYIKQNYK